MHYTQENSSSVAHPCRVSHKHIHVKTCGLLVNCESLNTVYESWKMFDTQLAIRSDCVNNLSSL